MDYDRYGSAPDPDPAYVRRTSRDRGVDRESDRELQLGQRPLPPRDRPWGEDPLEQRLDRWVNRGRQLVEGVSGARPGSRQAPVPGESRPGGRAAGIEGLGRWMGNRFDWLLDDGEDWREPWQEADSPRRGRLEAAGPQPQASRGGSADGPVRSKLEVSGDPPLARRRLEAVSLRGRGQLSTNPAAAGGRNQVPPAGSADLEEQDPARPPVAGSGAWPEDDVFKLDRWQRPSRQSSGPVRDPAPPEQDSLSGRPLPRSTRRR
jgi:hypothetical protein